MLPETHEEADEGRAYHKRTAGVVVDVQPFYLESKSVPAMNHYVWAYRVRIANERLSAVRLISRYWRITDSQGNMREVRGEGVVGEQPEISPGESYEYTSGAPLTTPSGMMCGSYHMEDADGAPFEVEIPSFSLDSPHENRMVN